MRLNAAGVVVQRTWDELPVHCPHVQLDQFVIMPNHVHGIIVLGDDGGAGGNDDEHVVRDDRDLAAIRDYIAINPARWLLDENHPGNGPVDW